jgi:hypothetical protein
MKQTLIIIIITIFYHNADAQDLFKFSDNEWTFNFLMIPKDIKSITTNYHATDFKFKSDSTFTMGMSEAAESGSINRDSTLNITLYDYNSTPDNKKWAKSFSVYFCSNDYLILLCKNVNYEYFFKNIKEFGDVWYVYSKNDIGWKKDAKKLYKKMKKEHKSVFSN